MSGATDGWEAAGNARSEWDQTDDVLNDLREVHAALDSLHSSLVRNNADEQGRQRVLAGVDRLGERSSETLSFLSEPVLPEDRTLLESFRQGRTISTQADAVADALATYADGGSWDPVDSAVSTVIATPEMTMGIDTRVLAELTTLFELAVEAGIRYREHLQTQLQSALETAYGEAEKPLGSLDSQPTALLPVRLETRFVDANGETGGQRTELLVRVYPDQIHTDSHETELTEKEVRWGKRFWATLWYARHPDTDVIEDANYRKNRLPSDELRTRVAGIDPAGFSDEHARRYAELKERAWQQLLDRFDRERASYIIRALKPTDEELATDLLTEPPQASVQSDGGENPAAESETDSTLQDQSGIDDSVVDDSGVDEAVFEGQGIEDSVIEESGVDADMGSEAPNVPGTINTTPDLPERLPELTFPSVSKRPKRWTKQARAKLLPDRWIAVAEWEDHTGESHRTAIAGDPIREPLPVGPSPESVAADSLESGESGEEDTPNSEEGAAPDGAEWMVDFQAAVDVGMGLRLPLTGLSGFDPKRGFTRLSVVGVRASVDPTDGNDELADLLDAHHYTDGLSFLPQGTPTNNHDGSAGEDEEFAEGLSVAASPPLVERGDLSDGDLLARALSIDPDEGEDHVFANVANADNTEQRDARHMNSALWPATIGYSLQHLYVDNEVVGNPTISADDTSVSSWAVETPERESLETEMLWLDAYRRHFIRYVRARGPFPSLRVGNQPYGVLPASPIETERDLSLIDPTLVADLGAGTLDVTQIERDGTSVRELAASGADPAKLVEAGANPDELVDAGVDPKRLLYGGVDPEEVFDATELVPDALLQDGIGVRATSQVTEGRLRKAGIDPDELTEAGITVRSLARGEVTDEQLAELGITTSQVADVILPEKAKALGLTPSALERANVTPATLLNGEFSDVQAEQLGLTTRAIADAMLPAEARELGITPKAIEDAGITPHALLNREISTEELAQTEITTEVLAEALPPAEAKKFGITPESLGAVDITVADLFNGSVSTDQLAAAGFDVQALEAALLPDAFREAGITTENLTAAGITPDAVINGLVTPEDLIEAGLTPSNLAEAGVLPDAVADVSQVLTDLLDAGLDPMTLVERGLTPQALVDAGVTPETLIEAGLAPKRLVDAGIDAVELAASGAASGQKLLDAGVSPNQLARAGVTVADLAGGDVPVKELVTTGTTALDLVRQGADALDLASEGARPSTLRAANVDAGTLREAGKAAGSLRTAGYTAAELLDSGYTVEELLNGGFPAQELSAAGVDPDQIQQQRRDAAAMLAAGHAPAELKQAGFAPDQLLEGGLDVAQLADAGYTVGELVDAGLTTEELLDAGLDIADLRAADIDTEALLNAGVELAKLRENGATAEELLDAGHDPEKLLDAGFERVELEVAGVDVDSLVEKAVDEGVSGVDAGDALAEGLQYAATVLEEPEQAERDAYRFSFDPAIPTGPSRGRSGSGEHADDDDTGGSAPDETSRSGESAPDGGVQSGTVPVVRPIAIDDRLDARLERELRGFGTAWDRAAGDLPFGHDVSADGLLNALERSAVSTDVRQQTMLYSGEYIQNRYTSFAYAVCKHLLKRRAQALRAELDEAGLRDRDPRLTYFAPLDAGPEDPWVNSILRVLGKERTRRQPGGQSALEQSDNYHELVGLIEWHLSIETQGVIEQYDFVDADIGQFIDVLLDSSVDDVHRLGAVIHDEGQFRPEQISADEGVTGFEADPEAWNTFDIETKRNRVVRAIEAADDPLQLSRRLTTGSLGQEHPKIERLGTSARRHGDSGALRSLLRILLQHGYLHEYLTARRRLGLAFDDIPSPWFDPAYRDPDADTMMETLRDDIPSALTAHPDIDLDETKWYREALQDAAANYTSTSSIDPRISEFTDSLRYLAGVDPSDLTTLVRETLDLANHRADAWWTSLATKRLLELREAQGTVDPDGSVDHDAWDGGGGDAPRATLDPALVGSLSTEKDGVGQIGGQPVDEITETDVGRLDDTDVELSGDTPAAGGEVPTGAGRQYDPAALGESLTSNTGEIDPTTDGGIDPTGSSAGGEQPSENAGAQNIGDAMPFDPDAADLDVANRVGEIDPSSLDSRAQSDPGLYVGGYGFVEDLSADMSDRGAPEYIHAPSEQHATTAAILKSGAEAHDADEGENVLALDLSAERVRSGLRLIRGVRRGQALSELLGYRFERRLHEATVEYDAPDLMQYADVFRKEFPQTVGGVERPDENSEKDDRLEELAARDTVDGLALLEGWEEYPFGRGGDLPSTGSDAYDKMETIVSDLGEEIDAAGDMLVAESVHQIGQGNFERAGGSVDALAKGAQLPDPDVIEAPRTGTGLTHRHCVLVGTTDAPVGTPRGDAAPSLATWVETLLPDLADVQCGATYRWEESANAGQSSAGSQSGEQPPVEHEQQTTLALNVLGLGPLDVLLLFGADQKEARSELEQRLAYHLIRERPSDVPADAEVELQLTETDGEVSVAELLELARSLREFVQSTRPATAADLAHPSDFDGEGYTEDTADALRGRANDAQDTLYGLAVDIDERLALFDADHTVGDGTDALLTGATSDGGSPAGTSWDNLDGSVFVPSDVTPALDDALAFQSASLPERVDRLVAAVRTVDEEVPLNTVETVANAIDPSAIRTELSTLLADLPAGAASPETARADHTVESASGQTITGRLMEPVEVPDVDPSGDTADNESGDDGETDQGDGAPSAGAPIAWGETDLAGEDIMGVSSSDIESVQLKDRPEVELPSTDSFGANFDIQDPSNQPLDDLDSTGISGGSDGGDGESENGDTDDGGSAGDEPPDVDWSTVTATVRVWGTDGTSWFEEEATVSPDSDGNFDASLDFAAVDPGTSFQVVAVVDGSICYSATGRVVADGTLTADAQTTLRSDCDTLRRLLWLLDRRPLLSTDEGASAELVGAHASVTEWDRIRSERDAVDPATSTVTSDELSAVGTLADLETFDPAAVPESVGATVDPVERLGLGQIVDVTGGEGGPDDLSYWLGANQTLTGVRARIERTLDDPSLYNEGVSSRLLKYDHATGALLHDLDESERTSAYLDAFLAQPAWTLRYLDGKLDATAATTVRNMTAWLYDPDSLDDGVDLAAELSDLATAARELPALTALFEGLPRGEADTRHEAFADLLDALAASLGSGVSTPSGADPAATFDSTASDATTALRDAVVTERSRVTALLSGPSADEGFRKVALEQLREPMAAAASYGVYGGTPTEPDGGSVAVTRALTEQARALLERLRTRLQEAGALDPRIQSDLSSQPLAQRVETQTDRLERLFGDGFTVLPPFTPTNREELSATFTDDGLVPDDRSLAVETWLQRSAAHRERVDSFREARSYAEAVAGSLTPSLTVGQLPFESGDTWVGAEDVNPESGRVSLVAQFGPGASPAVAGEQVVGLSVDEWTETVPAAEETTGIALNYDDPGSRAPQSILLVPPPKNGSPSLDHLAATVAETAEYAKRRSVTLADFESEPADGARQHIDPPFGLFPALHFVDYGGSMGDDDRGTPMVNFGMLDWYDKRLPSNLLADVSLEYMGGDLE
jgi:hypothetical protein